MKKYLKITNTGTMSRKFLELIGATDKRSRMDDSSTIGNKGSGAKFAIVPALRLGYEIAVSSTDDQGSYLLCYEKENVTLSKSQHIEQIVFNYVNGSRFPSQLTLDALRDWDQPVGEDDKKIFKALREYICNAWDADKAFTTEIVDQITFAQPGATSAYITFTEEIESILKNPARYIKFTGTEKPLFSNELYGNIYSKSEPGVTRLFCQGVLVDCKRSSYYSSIFDYSLDNKWLLSEERIIKDFNEYLANVAAFLVDVNDLTMVTQLLKALMTEEAQLEGDALVKITHIPSLTRKMYLMAWEATKGKKAILAIGSNQADNDARNKGYIVVEGVPYRLGEFLKKCGVKTSKDFATVVKKEETKKNYEIISLNKEEQSMYDEARKVFLTYFPKARLIPVIFFSSNHYSFEDVGGHCGIGDRQFKEIWIKDKSLVSVDKILKVLTHEGRHCFTKAGDYDRDFTQYADDQLVAMMMAGTASPTKTIWKSELLPNRGMLLPNRFVGLDANVIVAGKEVMVILSEKEQIKYRLTFTAKDAINGSNVRQQVVSKFNKTNFGAVHIPEKILAQLPRSISFEIFEVKTSQTKQMV